MGHTCDGVESNLVGINVAAWFLVVAAWAYILIQLGKGCRRYFDGDDFKSIFAGYERVTRMDGSGLDDDMRPMVPH
jgi:hypothetical protein